MGRFDDDPDSFDNLYRESMKATIDLVKRMKKQDEEDKETREAIKAIPSIVPTIRRLDMALYHGRRVCEIARDIAITIACIAITVWALTGN